LAIIGRIGLAMAMRHLGRIQRAILKLIDNGDADLHALEDLANKIYGGRATRSQHSRVFTAAQSLVRRFPEKIALAEDEIGRTLCVIRRN